MNVQIPPVTILLLLILLSGWQSVSAQKPTDLQQLGLRGQIKSIEYFNNFYGAGRGWSAPSLRMTESYNRDGNLLERSGYENEQLNSKTVLLYDEMGRNTGNNSYTVFSGLMNIPTRTDYVLDAAGKILELKVYSRDRLKVENHQFYKYDERGNQIEFNYGGGRSLMTYDARNNQTSRRNFNILGALRNNTSTEYDARNRKAKHRIYVDEQLRWEMTYRYDAKDRLTEIETKEFNSVPNQTTSHAPEAGRIVYTYDRQRKIHWATRHSTVTNLKLPFSATIYNEDQREIGFLCDSGNLLTCETVIKYEKDARQNMVRKTTYRRTAPNTEFRPISMEERAILYY